jgi:replicative DNA helicase
MTAFPTTARSRFRTPATADPIIDRVPPHDLAAEAGTIGSMMIDPQVIGPCTQFVSADDFFKEEHREVFALIMRLWTKHGRIDGTLIQAEARASGVLETIGGIEYLKKIANSVPTSANAEYYAAVVKECARKRQLISCCSNTLRKVYETDANATELTNQAVADILSTGGGIANTIQTAADAMHAAFESLEQRGLPTGLIELDNVLGGMYPGEMIVIGARPSVGKTAFAVNNVAWHAAKALGKKVLIFSLEMSGAQLALRMACAVAGVEMYRVRRNMMSATHRAQLAEAVGEVSSAPLYFKDTPNMPVEDILSTAHYMASVRGVDLIIVDYMQLITPPRATVERGNRTQQIGAVSRALKGLARSLNVPVIVLSQLNRESEKTGGRPKASELRESGDIEQDADAVLLLHREAVAHRGDEEWFAANPDKINLAEVIVAKSRNGICDVVKSRFDGKTMTFGTWQPGV